jgi:hypothetical protein
MPIAILYWVALGVWLVLSLWVHVHGSLNALDVVVPDNPGDDPPPANKGLTVRVPPPHPHVQRVIDLLLFILLLLVGLRLFAMHLT